MPRHISFGALPWVTALLGVGLILGGCASPADGADPTPADASPAKDDGSSLAATLDPCAKPNLTTVEPGALTFATSAVPAPPYFLSDDPSDRLGLESDLAYSLAEQLGFRPGEVTWEFVPAEQVLSGEFTAFDLALGGYSAVDSDSSAVDFSQPYLTRDTVLLAQSDEVRQAIEGVPTDEDDGLEPRSLRWGSSAHRVDDRELLSRGWDLSRVDSFVGAQELVTTGAAWSSADVVVTDDAHATWVQAIAGESPFLVSGVETPPLEYAFAVVKGNPLQPCIDRALGEMSEAGALDELKNRWLDPLTWNEG